MAAVAVARRAIVRGDLEARDEVTRQRSAVLLATVESTVLIGIIDSVRYAVAIAVAGKRRGAEANLPEVAEAVAVGVLRGVPETITVRVPASRIAHAPASLPRIREPVTVGVMRGADVT
jgi:hypothetical protein